MYYIRVSHRKLIVKLEAYGIGGKLLDWIKSFLVDRRQKAVMGKEESKWRDITSAVPQGSVLGPLLFVTEVEKCFGVMISSDGRNNKQVESVVSKANRALGRMRKTFKYFNIQLFKVLYPAFVRTHLEFASAVWNSMSRRKINRLEGIQKRATKMVIELNGMVYEDRLNELGITSLETRRKRGEFVNIYKIMKGFEIMSRYK
jgi:hypothetical protein